MVDDLGSKRTSKDRCVITTSKRFMVIYEFLYIIGLITVLVGAIIEYYYDMEHSFMISIIYATGLFVIATILWAIDRKCEIIKE